VGTGTVIYQGCTLGGTGKESGKRHPTVGRYCVISAGARVLGNITIGDYAKVGAGAVVLRDVPPHATVVGVPARIVRIDGSKEKVDLLPEKEDPMLKAVCELREKIFELEERLEKAEKIAYGENYQKIKEETKDSVGGEITADDKIDDDQIDGVGINKKEE
jgi:serine O-acetyltransferase